MNALKHGLRAKRHEALADSGYAYEERRRKWLAQHDAQTDYDEFMISGSVTLACKFERAQRMSVADVAESLGVLEDIYGLSIAPQDAEISLARYFVDESKRRPKQGDIVQLGPIALVAHRVADGRVGSVGLRLAEDDMPPATVSARIKKLARDLWKRFG